jgi:hypothetical protein
MERPIYYYQAPSASSPIVREAGGGVDCNKKRKERGMLKKKQDPTGCLSKHSTKIK